jgi:peptide/nickel transport system substrate-binding protein
MTLTRRSALLSPLALTALAHLPAAAQEMIAGLPRRETVILENPEGTIRNAGWFNIWAINAGGQSTGLHQLGLDTLWYIDPERGITGQAWENSLAAAPPEYNADFTEMRVRLRDGIFWSDGTEFTSADVAYTVTTQIANRALRWSAILALNVDQVTTPDARTVVFKLKRPNSRFHAQFVVRWGAIWIMPKHVFERQQDPARFDFGAPVSLGAYKLHSFDPQGKWYIWEKRADWQRTTIALYGEPGPRYVVYVDPGPPDKRVISQLNHELDVVHDVAPEGMFTLARQPQNHGWFHGFPFGHPDPTLISVIFNNQNPLFQNRDTRWALALLIDIRAVAMASYRGAATISGIAIPPTGTHPTDYHAPLESWLADFELDTGRQKIKPYEANVGRAIAESLRPTMRDQIPTDPAQVTRSFGAGWWKVNQQAATELLERAGFRKVNNQWQTGDGRPFTVRVMVEGDARPVTTRAGTMVAQLWRQFGIDARVDVAQGSLMQDRRGAGDFDTFIGWSVETYGGHPDLSYFLDSWHSAYVAQPGQVQPLRNWQRWKSPELDALIERMRTIGFQDPRTVELGRDFVKLMVREMPIIPMMAYNVFTSMDETIWTGFPSAETPYTNPVPNWANSRTMFVKLRART